MDRLLQLARSEPGSQTFRDELVKQMGADALKKGEAIVSHGAGLYLGSRVCANTLAVR